MAWAAPAQYEDVELLVDVVSDGVATPASSRGVVIEIYRHPAEGFTVEFDYKLFGVACLQDLKAAQFKTVSADVKLQESELE